MANTRIPGLLLRLKQLSIQLKAAWIFQSLYFWQILAAQLVSSVLRCFDFTGHENDQNVTRTSQKRKGNKGQRTSDCDGRMTKTASMMTANISEISDPNKKAKNWNTRYTEPRYFLVNMHVWWAGGPHWNLWHWYDWYVISTGSAGRRRASNGDSRLCSQDPEKPWWEREVRSCDAGWWKISGSGLCSHSYATIFISVVEVVPLCWYCRITMDNHG